MYSLIRQPPAITHIRELDRIIRVSVKEILHQELSRSDHSIYASNKDGGLEIPKLEWIVIGGALKNGINFLMSEDPLIKELKIHSGLEKRLRNLANSVRLNWPCTIKDVENFKRKAREENLEAWSNQKFQGRGVKALGNDPVGNHWLKNPSLLKPGRYLTALRMISNQVGLRVPMSIVKPVQDVKCRKCHMQPETLGHVIALCTYTKTARIRRHDEILEFVMKEAAVSMHGCEILREPHITASNQLYKPDLVIKSQGRVLVVDVSVRLEDSTHLIDAENEKIKKYSPLVRHLCSTENIQEGRVIPKKVCEVVCQRQQYKILNSLE